MVEENWRDRRERERLEARRRGKRMRFLVRAFVQFDGDIAKAFDELEEKERLSWMADDPEWLSRTLENPASAQEVLEEGIILNLATQAMQRGAKALGAAKVVLPALNKRRYNPAVQKQETANEGLSDFLKLVSRNPRNYTELVTQLAEYKEGEIIDVTPTAKLEMTVPTLDEAIAAAEGAGNLSEGKVAEEADLPAAE